MGSSIIFHYFCKNMWTSLTKQGFHTHTVLRIWSTISKCRKMPSISNYDLLIHYAMEEICKSFRTIGYWAVKLQLVKVSKCGSLVLLNSVTYTDYGGGIYIHLRICFNVGLCSTLWRNAFSWMLKVTSWVIASYFGNLCSCK